MPPSRYLPSAQFVLIVTSIALSGGLVWAAQFITKNESTPTIITSSDQLYTSGIGDWRAALYDVQGTNPLDENSGTVQASLDALFTAAKTTNVTNSVGRSLLLSLSKAKADGLGSDIPTQEKLIAEAATLLDTNTGRIYTTSDLTITSDTNSSLRDYGNAFIEVIGKHTNANVSATYLALGNAVDTNDEAQIKILHSIGTEYDSITKELLAVPVPQTLSPIHLQIVNNFSLITGSFTDMQAILDDPLRGFTGLQTYNARTGETYRMFTNIAQSFSKNGILFETDEPGSAWSAFLPE